MSFANTLVIMTSNVGSAVIAKGGGALGFQLVTDEEDGGAYSRVRSLVMEELKVLLAQHFFLHGPVSSSADLCLAVCCQAKR